MGKATRNYLLDVVLPLLALIVAVSSFLLLWVVFPQGYFPARALWVSIHKWGGLALGVAALLQVALHRGWLIHMTRHYLIYLQNMGRQSIERLSHLAQKRKTGISGGRCGQNL